MWRYLWQMHTATRHWAAWAATEIAGWPDTNDHPSSRQRGLDTMRSTLAHDGDHTEGFAWPESRYAVLSRCGLAG